MGTEYTKTLNEDAQIILDKHTKLDKNKPVSYLPIRTIERIFGMTASDYASLISKNGDSYIIFNAEQTCIKSGAVYAFNIVFLQEILDRHKNVLLNIGWPSEAKEFIRKSASEWLDTAHSITPIIMECFGEFGPSG